LINEDKKTFAEMLNTMFDIYGRKNADQNLMRVWWNKLCKYDLQVVSSSFDTYTSNSNKCPTPYDIIILCRSHVEAKKQALPKPKVSTINKEKLRKEMKELANKLGWK
tara:strand:- start:107 stop:430 length:324 start_codon:yes stop_codon:yes gene_type:complete